MSTGYGPDRWVRSGNARLAITEFGEPDAPPVVALHGFPECGHTWSPVAATLAASGYRVVAPDLRAHGASDAPRSVRHYRMALLLDDVEAVIDDLGLQRAVLLAHDWGGALAWLMSERRPHRLEHVVILNAPHPGVLRHAIRHDRAQRARSAYVLRAQIPWLPERRLRRDRAAYLAGLFPAEFYGPEIVDHYRDMWMEPGAVRGMLNWYRAFARDRSLHPPIGPIDVPMKVIWGSADPVFERSTLTMSVSSCADIDVVELAGCGHSPHRERPETVAEVVLGALA